MKTKNGLNIRDFRPIADWHAEGVLPMHLKHLQLICAQGKFPAVMIGGRWHTSEDWIASYFFAKPNAAAREIMQESSEHVAEPA